MNITRQNEIRQKATRLLNQCGIREAPVDVELIAQRLHILIRKSPTDDDISGFLLRQSYGSVIGVNTLHHSNRQRFTIAHELGHFLLHEHDTVHVDRALFKHRNELSSAGTNRDEVEANRFAAELLIPQAFLEKDLALNPIHDMLDDRRMQQLAKRYQVSVQAMTNRVVSLGYLPNEF
jgi:Zn-dependent peptidase ImmA (M78 family)